MAKSKSDSDPFIESLLSSSPLLSGDETTKLAPDDLSQDLQVKDLKTKGRSKSRARRDTKVRKKARSKILTEWRGGINPPDPTRNIHLPSEYLDDLLKSIGLSDGIDEQRLKDCWSQVAGKFVSQHSKPDSFKNGVLVLRVVQPMMKFHLQQMSGKLLENLRRELGEGTVKQVVFKIG